MDMEHTLGRPHLWKISNVENGIMWYQIKQLHVLWLFFFPFQILPETFVASSPCQHYFKIPSNSLPVSDMAFKKEKTAFCATASIFSPRPAPINLYLGRKYHLRTVTQQMVNSCFAIQKYSCFISKKDVLTQFNRFLFFFFPPLAKP